MLTSYNKEVLNAYYVPGTVLGIVDIIMNKSDKKKSLLSWADNGHDKTKQQMGACLWCLRKSM